ncbi:MAG: Demethyl 4-deoxygadusol synthase MysA [uncultured Caballeronia sp.]|nr:MAG: Demethyl 4-deoxygadusol synthase MysA [uncultured Caballeronia sp.]
MLTALETIGRQLPGQGIVDSFRMECRKQQNYDVHLIESLLSPEYSVLPAMLQERKVLVVTTPTVYDHYGELLYGLIRNRGLNMQVVVLPGGETNKTLHSVERICAAALEYKLDRRSLLIGLGGGVCTDVVAMAASAIRRGIDHLRIPTTLIGLIDAGIGLKGGVNLGNKKNYFGCFNPPTHALLDRSFLQTLPTSFLRHGMAEILKMALVADRRLFELCETYQTALIKSKFGAPEEVSREIIWRSSRLMLEELQKNPYESHTYQRLVDMGHAFSPALEAATDFRLHHGEAVAIDMALTVTLAESLGFMLTDERNRFIAVLVQAGLPICAPELTVELCEAALEEVVYHRGGSINFPMPVEISRCVFLEKRDSLPSSVISAALQRLSREASRQGCGARFDERS